MYYVYLIKSESSGRFYVGSTADLRTRLYQHNKGQSTATKAYVPWSLVYYEAFLTKEIAIKRERSLKSYGRGLVELKK